MFYPPQLNAYKATLYPTWDAGLRRNRNWRKQDKLNISQICEDILNLLESYTYSDPFTPIIPLGVFGTLIAGVLFVYRHRLELLHEELCLFGDMLGRFLLSEPKAVPDNQLMVVSNSGVKWNYANMNLDQIEDIYTGQGGNNITHDRHQADINYINIRDNDNSYQTQAGTSDLDERFTFESHHGEEEEAHVDNTNVQENSRILLLTNEPHNFEEIPEQRPRGHVGHHFPKARYTQQSKRRRRNRASRRIRNAIRDDNQTLRSWLDDYPSQDHLGGAASGSPRETAEIPHFISRERLTIAGKGNEDTAYASDFNFNVGQSSNTKRNGSNPERVTMEEPTRPDMVVNEDTERCDPVVAVDDVSWIPDMAAKHSYESEKEYVSEEDEEGPLDESTYDLCKVDPSSFAIFRQLKMHFDTPGSAQTGSLDKLAFGLNKKAAAELFYQTCVLASSSLIEVQQEDAYGDVLISRGCKM
ncbi:unnamed protein product [Lactuca virosa]|uniref:Rad21/Rec8-like protein C-terminal eukaryotic domain-containing protein n=1 Tax=Lactuca virosa TaxID=75947 RepID=A0AAU9NZV7_9ASTR|nr:unnamed protein product [Lactuca virosa]